MIYWQSGRVLGRAGRTTDPSFFTGEDCNMELQLGDKVALVCAASRGLGRAAALEFAREGARLAICSRSALIESAADQIRSETGAEVLALRADVARGEETERLVRSVLESYGRIDVLVINAGGPPLGSFLELTPESWESGVQLTLMSAVRLCRAVAPAMMAQGGGSIVAIGSITIRQPLPGLTLSNSLRLGVLGMLKSLADELGPQGIRINSINPSYTMTERVEQILAARAARNETTIETEMARMAESIPLGRLGTVEEFGRAVAWLASPAASFIHGHALMFDGGAARSPF
jgi:3-oxoacyl-[acyl-carrier protein] reductase